MEVDAKCWLENLKIGATSKDWSEDNIKLDVTEQSSESVNLMKITQKRSSNGLL
jgi:hypothetical protein